MAEKILIVDDDLETLRLVGLMLQKQGYVVMAASAGAQAIDLVKSEPPDLILLDVMMPEMDGFEVTRRLRAEPVTSQTPILMFTAKSQIEDKVIGYEAGADDYLTKPTHPTELIAHIKALLSRSKKAAIEGAPGKSIVVGVIAPKGGLGVSTLTLNLGIAVEQKTHKGIIAAEIRPGHGTWAAELNYPDPTAFREMLQGKPEDITIEGVEKELTLHGTGIRLLMTSGYAGDIALVNATAQIQALIHILANLSPIVFLDLGSPLLPELKTILALCTELIVVTEPNPLTVNHTKMLIEEMSELSFGKSRMLHVALINRIRSDISLNFGQVQDKLGFPVTEVFTPVPELAYQAALRNTPISTILPEGLTAQQFAKFAEVFVPRLK